MTRINGIPMSHIFQTAVKVVDALLGGDGDDFALLSCHEEDEYQNDRSFLAQVSKRFYLSLSLQLYCMHGWGCCTYVL